MTFRSLLINTYGPDGGIAYAATVGHVCQRLRADDWREASALLDVPTVPALERHLLAMTPRIAWFDAVFHGDPRLTVEPIALLGVWRMAPGVGAALMLATDEFPLIAQDLHRYVKERMVPALRQMGFRRIEVRALREAEGNCRWIEALGAVRECDVALLGRGGETYVQYAWLEPANIEETEDVRGTVRADGACGEHSADAGRGGDHAAAG